MSVLHFELEGPLVPEAADQTERKRDPVFCYTCLNLDAGSAAAVVPRPGLWMDEGSAASNAKAAASQGRLDSPPLWLKEPSKHRQDYTSWEMHANLTEISASAKRGCWTCRLLLRLVVKLGNGAISGEDPNIQLDIIFTKGQALRVWVDRMRDEQEDSVDLWGDSLDSEREVEENLYVLEAYTLPGRYTPWPTIGNLMTLEAPRSNSIPLEGGFARHVDPDPSSDSSFSIIRQWLDQCQMNHTLCRQAESRSTGRLPKRVIDIGTDQNSVRLHESTIAQASAHIPYVALSHCWGQTKHLLLTKNTVDQMKQNIEWVRLAKTFQDAIGITRRLGIQYIWIDSLCILQDDPNDWETEAAKMASVYSDAYLVLSATGSSDGDGGCLFPRSPYITVQGKSGDGRLFELYARHMRPHDAFYWTFQDKDSLQLFGSITFPRRDAQTWDRYPIFSRAWCFQERLLATRVLHFTKSEMVFECLTSAGCECGSLDNFSSDAQLLPHRVLRLGSSFDVGRLADSQGSELLRHHNMWRSLVMYYSQKRITYKSDILPALSGLAKKWYSDLTGDYMGGLWQKDLLAGLTWAANAEDVDRTSDYVAPSWSWASIQRAATWPETDFSRVRYFVDIDYKRSGCQPNGGDLYLRVSAGWIFLTGQIMKVILTRASGDGNQARVERRGSSTAFVADDVALCRSLLGKEVVCLRYSTNSVFATTDCALVLCEAKPRDLRNLPQEVSEYPNIYRRIGITQFYKTYEWRHEEEAELISLYIV